MADKAATEIQALNLNIRDRSDDSERREEVSQAGGGAGGKKTEEFDEKACLSHSLLVTDTFILFCLCSALTDATCPQSAFATY